MTTEAVRPRKKQRVGGVPPPAAAPSSSRAKFAFGSRVSSNGSSLLKGPKVHTTTRLRHDITTRAPTNPRKRRRSPSRDEDEAKSRANPSYRNLTMKTALPMHGSHLPAPTKVSDVLNNSHLHKSSPSNGSMKRGSAEQQELVAATDPEYWIQRREKVEAALKELESIEYVRNTRFALVKRIMSIAK